MNSFELSEKSSIGDMVVGTQCSHQVDHEPDLGVVWHDWLMDSRRSSVAASPDISGVHRTHGNGEPSEQSELIVEPDLPLSFSYQKPNQYENAISSENENRFLVSDNMISHAEL